MNFGLGTFARSGSAPFPGLVLGERVAPLDGYASVLDILSNWDSNFAALCRIAERGDAASVDASALRAHAPLVPRQIFCTIANYRSHIAEVVGDAGRAAQVIEERLRTPPYVCFK